MFAQYEPNVKATISFLKKLGVKVNDATVNETLQNHPDWPSMLCISDSLNKWSIPKPDKPELNRKTFNFPILWNHLLKDIAKKSAAYLVVTTA